MSSADGDLKAYSRELRRNMTDAERRLWSRVRTKQLDGCQFYRQRVLRGRIVDFFCPRARLIVEVDGGQHFLEDGRARDQRSDACFKEHGLDVLRFTDTEVLQNMQGVIEAILMAMRRGKQGVSPGPLSPGFGSD